MAYRVLVVDDSSFFCRRVKEILNQDPNLEVVGEARNGEEAINMVAQLKPDVVTMDVEMPVMDGITAVKRIMAQTPVPILMFSSLTHDGAQATLDALDAGALDFIPKKFEDIAGNRKEAIDLLQSRVKALASKRISLRSFRPKTESIESPGTTTRTRVFLRANSLSETPEQTSPNLPKRPIGGSNTAYKILAIGTSTGGPVALQKVLNGLPKHFPFPILLVQHMPGSFTKAFAERLNDCCQISVKEAENGDRLKPGWAYLAPGGMQMEVEGNARDAYLRISQGDASSPLTYKPSVDITFSSVSRIFKGDVLGIILTGMGADGREGSRALKNLGATIWAQDEKTSVVYGMPQAVTVANIAEQNIAIGDFTQSIMTEMRVK